MHTIDDTGRGLRLTTKINLAFGLASLLVLTLFLVLQLQSIRSSIHEEIVTSNRVASQLLARIATAYAPGGLATLTEFLEQTGRVRATDVELIDDDGRRRYKSPPSSYKAGREAPQWFAALVTPRTEPQVIRVGAGRLVIRANPTRAVLDSWDELQAFVLSQLALLVVLLLVVLGLVSRWLAPFEQIRHGLLAIESGKLKTRLPALRGRESAELGHTFNRMAQAIQDDLRHREEASHALARLKAQREFTQALKARIEEERSSFARELHDEFGQSLTAIRSISAALMQHPDIRGKPNEQAVRLLFDTAGATFDAMHRLIPRLRPLQLENTSLEEAIRDLVTHTMLAHASLAVETEFDACPAALDPALETCLYRIAQEALTNVIRHARAARIIVRLSGREGGIVLRIDDDGCGMPQSQLRMGRHGLRGMRERARACAGSLALGPSPLGGLRVEARFSEQKQHQGQKPYEELER